MTVRRSIRTGLLTSAVLCGALISFNTFASEPAKTTEDLEQCFVSPRDADKPWAYWWWINGNVDKSTITRDLEQMKEKGFAGLLLFDARGYHNDHCPPPPPRMEFMSPAWRELIRFAISEAGRMGLEMSINLSSCAGALKGPWLVMDDAPKRLIWTSADVSGPSQLKLQLTPSGDACFREVALFALKSAKAAGAAEAGAARELSGNWQEIQPQLDSDAIATEVLDLSENLDGQGQLVWSVPEGNWTLVRFARTAMAGHEYDVDVLDPAAVAGHFNRMGQRLLEYFVSGSGATECVFRVTGKRPELWCPRTGAIRNAVCYRPTEDGQTIVPLTVPEGGSMFVVFRKPADSRRLAALPAGGVEIFGRNGDRVKLHLWDNEKHILVTSDAKQIPIEPVQRFQPQEVAGAWEVKFSPEWGGPESITFDRLVPWNEHASEGIRYYSGTATYCRKLHLTKQQIDGLVRLQLGKVGHVAEVRLNGTPLGIVWCEPWSVDLTGVVREGENLLEIDVVNLWMNRLIGDSALPPEQRRTKTNVRFFSAGDKYQAFEGFSPKDSLAPSGLIGPVRLEFGREVEVIL